MDLFKREFKTFDYIFLVNEFFSKNLEAWEVVDLYYTNIKILLDLYFFDKHEHRTFYVDLVEKVDLILKENLLHVSKTDLEKLGQAFYQPEADVDLLFDQFLKLLFNNKTVYIDFHDENRIDFYYSDCHFFNLHLLRLSHSLTFSLQTKKFTKFDCPGFIRRDAHYAEFSKEQVTSDFAFKVWKSESLRLYEYIFSGSERILNNALNFSPKATKFSINSISIISLSLINDNLKFLKSLVITCPSLEKVEGCSFPTLIELTIVETRRIYIRDNDEPYHPYNEVNFQKLLETCPNLEVFSLKTPREFEFSKDFLKNNKKIKFLILDIDRSVPYSFEFINSLPSLEKLEINAHPRILNAQNMEYLNNHINLQEIIFSQVSSRFYDKISGAMHTKFHGDYDKIVRTIKFKLKK